jgi:hypothetical protein
MRNALAFAVAIGFAAAQLGMAAPSPRSSAALPFPQQQEQSQQPYEPYTAEQLDNLLAPIALYPDPLLAQVLVASTFVDQIDQAARYVRAFGQSRIDEQPWDVSVRAVAHYPTVLSMMDDNLDWTTALGQAYVNQSTDVMSSVQRLRAMANAQGNLQTTPQQQVIVEPGYIQIVPASPQYIYIPYYDPAFIYFRPGYVSGIYTGVIVFGPGWPIGVWLNLDFMWPYHQIYYTGWIGGGWIGRCRPYIRMSPYYVNNRYRHIALNRGVMGRPVNYSGLSRYRSVHPRVNYENRIRGPMPRSPAVGTTNKMINRNINIYDPNLNRFRGRPSQPAARPVPQPRPGQPTARPGQSSRMPSTRPPVRPAPAQRPPNTRAPSTRPPTARPPAARPSAPRAPAARPPSGRPHSAFNGGNTVFSPKQASQRGQASRSQQGAQPPAARSAPKGGQPKAGRPHQQRRQP